MSSTVTAILILFLFIIVVFFIINHRDMHRFVIVPYEVCTDRLRGSLRICLLADLHDNVYGDHNDTLIAAIAKEAPDVILIAGDLITAYHTQNVKVQRVKTDEAIRLVKACAKIALTFFSPGNHETKLKRYDEEYDGLHGRLYQAFRDAGAVILEDESASLALPGGETVTITGLELDYGYFSHFKKRPMKDDYLTQKLGARDEAHYTILMAHNPQYFPEYAAYGAELTVAGHVHGGIIRLPLIGGVMSPAVIPFPKYDGGRFDIGEHTMILSRGLGTHSIPVRAGNPAEVVMITLRGTAEKDVG